MELDTQHLRNDTPGCETRAHFNNAGAALMPKPVIEAIQNHITLESTIGGYESAEVRQREIDGFYESAARLLNTQPANIAYTSSATSAFDRALTSIPFEKGDTILLAEEDYVSNQLAFLSLQQRFGVKLIRARSLPEGGVDVDDMTRLMKQHQPRLVTLTHVPTNSGLVQPVAEVGKRCKEFDLTYLVDACQSAGQLPLDVNDLHCDFLSVTLRKFLRGPRGAGFLYVSDRVIKSNWEPMFVDMRGADWTATNSYKIQDSARRFEEWENPYALVLGAKAAIDYALKIGIPEIEKVNRVITHQCSEALRNLGLKLLDRGQQLCNIITAEIPNKEATETVHYLRSRNVNTSSSARSSALIDFERKGVDWALRISPHYYNSIEEIEQLTDALDDYLSKS